jgi:Glycosyl hydrolase family 30 beta sandwich domain
MSAVPSIRFLNLSNFVVTLAGSKFIRLGARRIINAPTIDNLLTTPFANPDGVLAVVVMNQADRDRFNGRYSEGSPTHIAQSTRS